MITDSDPTDPDSPRKLGDISRPHFKEDHRIVDRNVIVPAFLLLLQPVFVLVPAVWTAGNDPNGAITHLFNNLPGGLVQLNTLNS